MWWLLYLNFMFEHLKEIDTVMSVSFSVPNNWFQWYWLLNWALPYNHYRDGSIFSIVVEAFLCSFRVCGRGMGHYEDNLNCIYIINCFWLIPCLVLYSYLCCLLFCDKLPSCFMPTVFIIWPFQTLIAKLLWDMYSLTLKLLLDGS